MDTDKTNKDATKYREEFKQEMNMSDSAMHFHSIGFRHEYVMWLETKLYLMEIMLNKLINEEKRMEAVKMAERAANETIT
jgi:hypothetical protein